MVNRQHEDSILGNKNWPIDNFVRYSIETILIILKRKSAFKTQKYHLPQPPKKTKLHCKYQVYYLIT